MGFRLKITVLLGILLLSGLSFAGWLWFLPSPLADSGDPLCKMVSARFSMSCVPLATPRMYDRGAIMRLSDGSSVPSANALPDDYLFSDACIFSPDALQSVSFREDPKLALDFGKHKYSVDRNAALGVDLNLPKVAGIKFKAGPKISQLRDVVLEAESMRYFNIDSQAFLTSLRSCAIRPACISRVKSSSSSVIKRFIIAKNLKYTINLSSGGSESLLGAVKTDQIKIDADIKRADTSTDDLSSGEDLVVGVGYFDRGEVQAVDTCTKELSILKATGNTKVYAKVGTPGMPPVEKESSGDEDIMAVDMGRDANDRKSNESMIPGEARAFGGWFFHNDSQEVEFHLRNVSISGIRYPNLTMDDARDRLFAVIYTHAHAVITSQVELTVANRTEETKRLVAMIQYDVGATPDKMISAYAWFDPFVVVAADGSQRNPPEGVLSTHTSTKQVSLGNIGPGEVIRVKMGRKLESASSATDFGTIEENTKVRLELRPAVAVDGR